MMMLVVWVVDLRNLRHTRGPVISTPLSRGLRCLDARSLLLFGFPHKQHHFTPSLCLFPAIHTHAVVPLCHLSLGLRVDG